MGRKAIFLDRDGTINKNFGYVYSKKKFVWLKKSIEAIRYANRKKFLVIVVTNQSGVSRGFFTRKDVMKLHNWMNKDLKKHNAKIDKFYFSTYHKDFSKSKKDYFLRKPRPGMILAAVKEYNIDLTKSFLIGDSLTDKKAAQRMNLKFVKKKYNLLRCVKFGEAQLTKVKSNEK